MIKSIEMNNEKSTLNSTATKNEAIVRQTHKIAQVHKLNERLIQRMRMEIVLISCRVPNDIS